MRGPQDQYYDTFSYHAEGRILSGGSGTYVYDGAGNRLKKTASSVTTLYWPGAGGVLDESNGSGSTMGKQVRFAGRLVYHEDTSGTGRTRRELGTSSSTITWGLCA